MTSWPTPDVSGELHDAPTAALPQPRYQRLGELGRGGMGEVWLGWDAWLQRNVALKLPLGGAGSPAERALMREALLAARLDHPAIVSVVDVVIEADGRAMFVMRLERGRPLGHALAEGQRARALRVMRPIAEAIAHAHDRGVVHRDLSPSNVLVGDHGEVSVIDWGVAAEVGDPDAPRRVGTPGHAAPE
ncbi:MAG TPA: serine/threonine-protein kinase, partial [Myxococcota bacterium]|nr:serine/threonine-protein kinase [Myxococcota bacterium]